MELLRTLAQVIGTGLLSALFVSAAAWLLRSSMAAALTRSVNRELETLRADFNERLELMRYELNREAHKADLVAKRRHEFYPDVLEKFKSAERVVSQFVEQQTNSTFRTQDLRAPTQEAIKVIRDLLDLKSLHFDEAVRKAAVSAVIALERVVKDLDEQGSSTFTFLKELRGTPYWPARRSLAQATVEIQKVEVSMRQEIEAATRVKNE